MPTQTIASISVDCTSALQGKCYIPEIVAVAEQYTIPLTWLIGVNEHDPLTNVKLYHNEYLHRIPAWHELGLLLQFDSSPSNTVDRGDLIRIGKDVLKQCSIKPSAFRAANGDIQAVDLRALEDIGIVVDATTGSASGRPLGSPSAPYHPSYTNLHQSGDAKIWVVPVANVGGIAGNIDEGFDKVKSIIDASLAISDIVSLTMSDSHDNSENLGHVVSYLKARGARFVTLTQLASEL